MIDEPRKLVFLRVRRVYYDQIVSGLKRSELRADIPRWSWLLGDDPPGVAFFACGKDRHYRRITRIYRGVPEEILGRALSDQGRRDIPTETCIVIELGDEWRICPFCGGVPWARYYDEYDQDAGTLAYFGCDNCEVTFTPGNVVKTYGGPTRA